MLRPTDVSSKKSAISPDASRVGPANPPRAQCLMANGIISNWSNENGSCASLQAALMPWRGTRKSSAAFSGCCAILASMIKTEKPPADLELKRRIQDLIDYKGGGFNQENVADIIENALKILSDIEDTGDVRVIQTAVRELRYAFRLF